MNKSELEDLQRQFAALESKVRVATNALAQQTKSQAAFEKQLPQKITVYRYVRGYSGYDWQDNISNMGGMTFKFVIDYDKKHNIAGREYVEVDASVAICSKNDNFNKTLGRAIADRRMAEGDYFTFDFAHGLMHAPLVYQFMTQAFKAYSTAPAFSTRKGSPKSSLTKHLADIVRAYESLND